MTWTTEHSTGTIRGSAGDVIGVWQSWPLDRAYRTAAHIAAHISELADRARLDEARLAELSRLAADVLASRYVCERRDAEGVEAAGPCPVCVLYGMHPERAHVRTAALDALRAYPEVVAEIERRAAPRARSVALIVVVDALDNHLRDTGREAACVYASPDLFDLLLDEGRQRATHPAARRTGEMLLRGIPIVRAWCVASGYAIAADGKQMANDPRLASMLAEQKEE